MLLIERWKTEFSTYTCMKVFTSYIALEMSRVGTLRKPILLIQWQKLYLLGIQFSCMR